MTTTHRNGFEGQTNGTTVTLLNSANSGDAFTNVNINGGSIVYSTTRAATGTVSLLITPNGAATCYVDDASFNSTQLVTSFCFYYGGAPSVPVTIFQARTAAGGSFGMNISTAGKLTSTDSLGGTANLAANALVSGHWYRIEMQGLSDATAGTIAYQYFIDNAGSAVESLSSSSKNTRGGNITTARYGTPAANTGYTTYTYDNVQSADGTLTALGAWAVPPVAAFTSTVIGSDVVFDATGSTYTSPATGISSYVWSFGDTGTGTGSNPTHQYTSAGTKTVSLTVTDSNGQTNTVSHNVTITLPGTTAAPNAATGASGTTPSTLATVLTNLTDTSSGLPVLTTWVAMPNGTSFTVKFGPVASPQSGQPALFPFIADRTSSTTGTMTAELWQGDPAGAGTLRSSVTVTIPDTVASGGSGDASTGTVGNGAPCLAIWPWTDVQNITDWNQLQGKFTSAVS